MTRPSRSVELAEFAAGRPVGKDSLQAFDELGTPLPRRSAGAARVAARHHRHHRPRRGGARLRLALAARVARPRAGRAGTHSAPAESEPRTGASRAAPTIALSMTVSLRRRSSPSTVVPGSSPVTVSLPKDDLVHELRAEADGSSRSCGSCAWIRTWCSRSSCRPRLPRRRKLPRAGASPHQAAPPARLSRAPARRPRRPDVAKPAAVDCDRRSTSETTAEALRRECSDPNVPALSCSDGRCSCRTQSAAASGPASPAGKPGTASGPAADSAAICWALRTPP